MTKLRMDAIGRESEYGSFESGPHMSTEDNIIMRMFSPQGKKTASGGNTLSASKESKGTKKQSDTQDQSSQVKTKAQMQAEEDFENEFAESLSLSKRNLKGNGR